MEQLDRRLLLRTAFLGGAATPLAAASVARKLLRLLQPKDPQVVDETYHAEPDFFLGDKSISVFPFETLQSTRPLPPDFGRFLSLDLMQDLDASRVHYRTSLPWGNWLDHRARKLSPGRQREILANSADTDLVVYGRVFNAIPTVRGAVKIEAELWLLKRNSAKIHWYGFKRIEWKKKVRMDDAMAHAASLYVLEWPLERLGIERSPRTPSTQMP